MNWRLISGGAIWLIGLGLLGNWYAANRTPTTIQATEQISTYLFSQRQRLPLHFDRRQPVRTFDPIFMRTEDGFVQVGAIERVDSPDSASAALTLTDWARAEFFSNAPQINGDYQITYYQTPESMDFVLTTMLPPEKRRQIAELIAAAYAEHHQEIFSQLRPILEQGLQEAAVVVQEEFHASVMRHKPELEKLGARYQQELVDDKIIPLVNKEIWPIVRKTAEPLLNQVGQEIWQEASIWRFGWAILYDATPLPQRDLAKKEFNRFVENKAMPILTKYVPEFIQLQQEILTKISKNEKVLKVVRESFQSATRDPELQKIAVTILQEVFVENTRLRDVVNRYWSSDETQRILQFADSRLEPTVTQIGELLFGNPRKFVTPEFARVLRARVLGKDHRWFLLEKTQDESPDAKRANRFLHVHVGGETHENPFHYPAPETQAE